MIFGGSGWKFGFGGWYGWYDLFGCGFTLSVCTGGSVVRFVGRLFSDDDDGQCTVDRLLLLFRLLFVVGVVGRCCIMVSMSSGLQ